MLGQKKFIGLLSVFLILFSVLPAFALQEQFDVVSAKSIAACSNGVTTDSITIRNTGDIESGFTISDSGSASEFTTFSETSVSVKPGESKTVFAYMSPSGRKGNYDLSAIITSALGEKKSVSQSIEVQNCANMQVSIKTPTVTVNPCQVSQFSFDIANTGDYAETYDFKVKGLEGYTTVSTNSIFLAPQERKQIDVFVNPSCNIYGQKELTLQTTARTSQYVAQAHVVLNILQNYEYAVAVQPQVTVCNAKQIAIPISIANKVPFVNQYDITIHGPNFLKQEARRVELGPYMSGITNLFTVADHAGSYPIDIIVKSVRGDVIKAGTQNLTVENCYDANVNIENPSDIVIAGNKASYKVTILNQGTKTDSYTFELNAPSFVTFSGTTLQLNPKESKTLTLEANVPSNVTGSFVAVLKAISKETGIVKGDKIQISVLSPDKAYSLKISPRHLRVLFGQDAVILGLQNKGILPATYDFSLKAPSWMKLAQNSITLQPGEKKDVFIATSADKKKNQVANYEASVTATVKGSVGFVSKFNISLREVTLLQELYIFSVKYMYFLIAGAVVLLILLFILIFGNRIARRYRAWKIKRAEIAKIKAELKQRRKEEKLAKKLMKESLKRSHPSKFWKRFFGVLFILVALVLLTGAVLYGIGYGPIAQEFFKQKQAETKFAPIVKVNTTGLEAYGNTVIVRGTDDVIVPIIVKNNFDNDLTFGVEVNQKWIKTNVKEIRLEAGDEEVIKLRITPSATEDGVYKIRVSAQLEQEDKIYNEDITLNIRKKNVLRDILNYVPYVVGGIVVLIAGLYFYKKRKRESREAFASRKAKPARKIEVSLPKKR